MGLALAQVDAELHAAAKCATDRPPWHRRKAAAPHLKFPMSLHHGRRLTSLNSKS